MKIIKATEPIPVEHPVFMMFGQPGICKSSLAYSMRDSLLLDFDGGSHRAANRTDTVPIGTWADVEDLLKNRAALEPYASIIVDTVGRSLDILTADICASDPKKSRGGGELNQQGWGVLKTRFRAFVNAVKGLRKDLLLVAHDKEEKDGDTRIVRPDIVGGSYGEVMKSADFVGYLYMAGKDRILDFNPTDRWIGKNPAQWAPFTVPPVGKATDFFAELYARGRNALGQISEASALVAQAVIEFRAKAAAFTTADQFNDAIAICKGASAVLAPQFTKILLDAAAVRGVPFDKTAKRFAAPAVVAPPVVLPPTVTPAMLESEFPDVPAAAAASLAAGAALDAPLTAGDIFGRR